MLRFRRSVVAFWLVVAAAGFVAYEHLAPILTNQFTVPGTDSDRVRVLLEKHFGERPDGSFQVVFRVGDSRDGTLRAKLEPAVARAAAIVPTGQPTPLIVASRHVVYADVVTTLGFSDAKRYTPRLLHAVGKPPGVEQAY